MVFRQYRARQFVPITSGLNESGITYRGDHYKKRARDLSLAWKRTFRTKVVSGDVMYTPDYEAWRFTRKNENVPLPDQGRDIPWEEHIKVVPSQAEILNAEFEAEKKKWDKAMEEGRQEKFMIYLDRDLHAKQCELLRKDKEKVNLELANLKRDFRNLQKAKKIYGSSKTSQQWAKELAIEKRRVQSQEAENKCQLRRIEVEKKLRDKYKTEKIKVAKQLKIESRKAEKWKAEKETSLKEWGVEKHRAEIGSWMQRFQTKSRRLEQLTEEMEDLQTSFEEELNQSRVMNGELKDYISHLEDFLLQVQVPHEWMNLRLTREENNSLREQARGLESEFQRYRVYITSLEREITRIKEGWKDTYEHHRMLVEERERMMGEAIAQMSEVAHYTQELANRAEIILFRTSLSSEYEEKVVGIMNEIMELNNRAKLYL
ncbi:coiled-coil domain-containing protein 186-like [Hibiscus syriacus]|uniref:coiled-coil domain-containing protein 186-like n=1 Tax=Hibiscus syriacus TaxID=106335 RepID=UPI001923A29C|nr:coiled-coil domain-containing protein 186-like [Hibiscus syriacus]